MTTRRTTSVRTDTTFAPVDAIDARTRLVLDTRRRVPLFFTGWPRFYFHRNAVPGSVVGSNCEVAGGDLLARIVRSTPECGIDWRATATGA